ncbi:MAG: TIM barrel protein [Phycisphaeraceae bacterium]
MTTTPGNPVRPPTRRAFLSGAGTAAATAALMATTARAAAVAAENSGERPSAVTNGKIKQSVMGWCFNPMPTEELARKGKALGLVAIEGISEKHYPLVRDLGLKISLVGSHGFAKGPCDPANRDMVIKVLNERIDLAAEVGAPGVITFTGMRVKGLTDKQMSDNCVEAWKQVIGHAEKKKINLVFEHLNTRDNTHPMKGHPGYYGDDVDLCADLIKRVDSPNMKLLFDIYHVQIMHGDVIRRLNQLKSIIGHYHTAGVPGRGELDETQELNYPAIMKAILATGYEGYVAQEFIPTWEDKIGALGHAIKLCDVK